DARSLPSTSSRDAATPAVQPLSLHGALPISCRLLSQRLPGGCKLPHPGGPTSRLLRRGRGTAQAGFKGGEIVDAASRQSSRGIEDRKSTRLNSSHVKNSYAVFCLKKQKRQLT